MSVKSHVLQEPSLNGYMLRHGSMHFLGEMHSAGKKEVCGWYLVQCEYIFDERKETKSKN